MAKTRRPMRAAVVALRCLGNLSGESGGQCFAQVGLIDVDIGGDWHADIHARPLGAASELARENVFVSAQGDHFAFRRPFRLVPIADAFRLRAIY